MKRRHAPRRLADGALGSLVAGLQPASLLADVQRIWPRVAGPALAARATPTAARAGTVAITCESAVWAQELTLMAGELVALLDAELGPGVVRELRCSVAPPQSWVRPG